MKTSELRAKSKEELQEIVLSLKKEQFNLRMQAATGALENRSRFKEARRTIARAKTLMNEKGNPHPDLLPKREKGKKITSPSQGEVAEAKPKRVRVKEAKKDKE
jgi:large subunit ribosomal protein L29